MHRVGGQTLGMERYWVQTKGALNSVIRRLEQADEIAVDTETTGLEFRCGLVGLGFSDGETGWYIPVGHSDGEQVPLFYALDAVRPILESSKIKIFHNLKFDYKVLAWAGVDVNIEGCLDTMIAHWLLNENGRHGLKGLVKDHLGYQMREFTEVVAKGMRFSDLDIDTAAYYASDDPICTFRLMEHFAPMLAREDLFDVFRKVEMPFVKVLAEMEMEGAPINADFLREQRVLVEAEILTLETAIHETAGRKFDIQSPQQLGTVLFTEMGIPVLKTTPKGKPSTDVEVLGSLAQKGYPIAKQLARYRKLQKVLGTYIIGLLEQIRSDGKLHGSFNQHGTVTGRLSSSNPNLQNIPVKFKDVPIRKAFETPPGWVWVNADYSQIELRIMAHFSQDPAMMKAYELGQDLHCATASLLSGIPYDKFIRALDKKDKDEELTSEEELCIRLRGQAKAVNFGIIYGRGPMSLAEGEGMSISDAKHFIAQYFASYQGVQRFITLTHNTCKANGEVKLLTGRKRRLKDIYSDDKGTQAMAKRQAVNSKIQGSSGDLMKLAMNKLHYEVLPPLGARLCIQVHDKIA